MDWITCPDCDEEFKIITDSLESISFCPFCAEEIDLEYDEEDDFEDE